MAQKFSYVLLGLSFFFFSVASFSIKSGVFAYATLVFAVFLLGKRFLPGRLSLRWLVFFILLSVYITAHTLFSQQLFVLYLIKYYLFILYVGIVCYLFSSYVITIAAIDAASKVYLVLHLILFFLQLIIYLVTGEYLDFNNMLREEYANTAYISRDVVGLIIPIRATGVFSEPSFFSMSILPFVAFIHYRKCSPKLVYLGTLTSLLSLSAAAIVITLAWMLSLLWGKINRKLIVFLPVIALCSVVAGGVAYDRIFESKDYDATGARLRFVGEIKNRGAARNILGAGFFYDEFGGNGVTLISAAAIRDSGMYVMLLYSGGVVGLLIFLSMLLYWFRFGRVFFGVLILCLFKYGTLTSVFWLFMCLFVMVRKNLDVTSRGSYERRIN